MTHGHAPRRSAAEQARLDAALTTLFEQQIRFNQLLGLKFIGARRRARPCASRCGPNWWVITCTAACTAA